MSHQRRVARAVSVSLLALAACGAPTPPQGSVPAVSVAPPQPAAVAEPVRMSLTATSIALDDLQHPVTPEADVVAAPPVVAALRGRLAAGRDELMLTADPATGAYGWMVALLSAAEAGYASVTLDERVTVSLKQAADASRRDPAVPRLVMFTGSGGFYFELEPTEEPRRTRASPAQLAEAVARACADRGRDCFRDAALRVNRAPSFSTLVDAALLANRVSMAHTGRPIDLWLDLKGVPSALPPPIIQAIVRSRFEPFRKCYERGLADNPELRVRVEIRFVIGMDGSVPNTSASHDLTDDTIADAVAECVAAEIAELVFPPPIAGIVTVSYPIVFSPAD